MGKSTIFEIIYWWFIGNICYYFAKKYLRYHWICNASYRDDKEEYWGSYIDWMVSRTNWIIDEENNKK